MGLEQHRTAGPVRVAAYVVTLSDTREATTDAGGGLVRAALEAAGHVVAGARIVREDVDVVRSALLQVLDASGHDVVIVTGGTGIAPRDVAYDVLATLYERPIPGFGELFRALSFTEIGSAAMLSRASAGIARGKLVVSIPGAPAAARLALERLILPELGHLVGEIRKHPPTPERRP
jgi:molybdenum cofactor biosynthesis protein B